jgi:hypothetical protein
VFRYSKILHLLFKDPQKATNDKIIYNCITNLGITLSHFYSYYHDILAILPFCHFIILTGLTGLTILNTTWRYSTLLDASRRFSTLLDATWRYLTLLNAFRRYSTLLDAARRCSTLLDAARRCLTLLDATLIELLDLSGIAVGNVGVPTCFIWKWKTFFRTRIARKILFKEGDGSDLSFSSLEANHESSYLTIKHQTDMSQPERDDFWFDETFFKAKLRVTKVACCMQQLFFIVKITTESWKRRFIDWDCPATLVTLSF